MMREIRVGLLLAFGWALLSAQRIAPPNILPSPNGTFGIGRVTYHWIDSSRAAFLDDHAAARRELMVDLWYPTRGRVAGQGSDYFPNLQILRRALTDSARQASQERRVRT
jgi:hypothetical protein